MYFKKMNRRPKRTSHHVKLTDDKSLQDTTYRCAVCGFLCDRKKVKSRTHNNRKGLIWADGNVNPKVHGSATTFTSLDSAIGTVTYYGYESDIQSGCPNCGTPDSK